MQEISLHILDVANNSIRANAKNIEIIVNIDNALDVMTILIKDDGNGMSEIELEKVIDPFFTTRTTRKVGLGIPFFKQSAESTNGSFHIESKLTKGTCIKAVYTLSHIDRLPLGDMTSTIQTLITYNENIDFLYKYTVDNNQFTLDTIELKNILGDVPFNNPEVYTFIKNYLQENHKEINNYFFNT